MAALLVTTAGTAAHALRSEPKAPIAVSGDHVYVTWETEAPGNWEIMVRASHDGGRTFADKLNLSQSPDADSVHPTVAAVGSHVYVSFHDARSGSVDTYVRASADAGRTFGAPVLIAGTGTQPQTPEVLDLPQDPLADSVESTTIAASGPSVYVVSWDKKSGNWEVFLAASHDQGQTFGDTRNLSNTPQTRSDQAWLVADGPDVYVSWWETAADGRSEPVMRVSHDNAATFGPTLHLAADGAIGAVA